VPSYDFDILNFGQSKNNIISQTTEDLISPGTTYNMIWTYTYNLAGLPETVTNSDDNGTSYYEKLVFAYEKH
jgi:hypothetical protein